MRRARFFGTHAPRDKEHHLASRKCRRESTPQTRAPVPFCARPGRSFPTPQQNCPCDHAAGAVHASEQMLGHLIQSSISIAAGLFMRTAQVGSADGAGQIA